MRRLLQVRRTGDLRRTDLLRRTSLAPLLVVAGLAVGGAAYAYWSTSGAGTGSGASATTVAVTLGPGTPVASLYPGGQASVAVIVSNSNESPVQFSLLSLDTGQGTSGFAVDAGHSACNVSALSFTDQTNGGAGWTVPGKVGAVNGSLPVTLTDALTMREDASNACQGATSTVYLAATP